MKPISRVRGGHKARVEGNQFEALLELQCRMQGIVPTKIKTFCRYIANLQKWVPEKAPFDYILSSDISDAFIDCKSISAKSFKKVQGDRILIKEHQEDQLLAIERKGRRAGFLIWFRKENKVVFILASTMKKIRTDEPITSDMGEYLGTYESIALGNLFT